MFFAAILEGPDANESHLYLGGAAHAGIDASAGLTIGFVQSELPLSQFNAETLSGLEIGASGGVGPVGAGVFSGRDLPSFKETYNGISFSLGEGVRELPFSATVSASWSERLGKIQTF